MAFHAQARSFLGTLLLCATEDALTGVYFVGQKDCPPLPGLPSPDEDARDPRSGRLHGAPIREFRVRRNDEPDLFFPDSDLADRGLDDASPVVPLEPLQIMQEPTPAAAMTILKQAWRELDEYFKGDRRTFDVPLQLEGTAFQKAVWKALLSIPYGEYVSYGDVARRAGLSAGHGRAVGTAVGRNPLTILVPCHRVLSSSGKLNGYTGGLARKLALLQIEGFTAR